MSALFAQATIEGPKINWEALSPAISLTAGACVVLLVGLARSAFTRRGVVSFLTLVTLGVTAGLAIWQWDVNEAIIARALVVDNLTLTLTLVFCAGGIAAGLMSWRPGAAIEAGGGGEYPPVVTAVFRLWGGGAAHGPGGPVLRGGVVF